MGKQNAYLDLTIVSASDLKRGWISGDQTVAIAWIDPSSKKSTAVTRGGGSSAQWNEMLTLPLNDANASAYEEKWLTIEIRSPSSVGVNILGTALVPVSVPLAELVVGSNLHGTVRVPLAELALDSQNGGANSTHTYEIVHPSGKRCGNVSFLCKIVKAPSCDPSILSKSVPPIASSHGHDAGYSQFNESHPPAPCSPVKCSADGPLSSTRLPSASAAGMCPCDRYSEFNMVYPPVSHSSAVEIHDERGWTVHSAHSLPGAFCYPPQAQDCASTDSVHQYVTSKYSMYGMASDPQGYPLVNAPYPPTWMPCSSVEGMTPAVPYPPPSSMYQNYPSPPVPHPPIHSVPYPPIHSHPHSDPYYTHSIPFHPPLYRGF